MAPFSTHRLLKTGTESRAWKLAVDFGFEVLVGDDNPAFEGVFEFCSISAGGTIGMQVIDYLIHH